MKRLLMLHLAWFSVESMIGLLKIFVCTATIFSNVLTTNIIEANMASKFDGCKLAYVQNVKVLTFVAKILRYYYIVIFASN